MEYKKILSIAVGTVLGLIIFGLGYWAIQDYLATRTKALAVFDYVSNAVQQQAQQPIAPKK